MEKFGMFIMGLVMLVVIALLVSLPVMWLWNGCLVGAIVGVKAIGWFQALGLTILSGTLFKSNGATVNTNKEIR